MPHEWDHLRNCALEPTPLGPKTNFQCDASKHDEGVAPVAAVMLVFKNGTYAEDVWFRCTSCFIKMMQALADEVVLKMNATNN